MSKSSAQNSWNATHVCKSIAAGALFHDLGKFAERASEVPMGDKEEIEQEYRYAHAYSTEWALKRIFGDSSNVSVGIEDNVDETLINLASRHHKPRYYFERIVQIADQWASGHERASADEVAKSYPTTGRQRKNQIPLVSILSRVQVDEGSQNSHDWYCPLSPAIQGEKELETHIFPRKFKDYTSHDVEKDYPLLWGGFLDMLGADAGPSKLHPVDDFETLFEVCRQYQWCIPASTRYDDMPDVSLFEHAKGTAAIASCLYLYHENDTKKPSSLVLADKDTEKFILFCADIAGIQQFIYQISSKGAYRHLKGRSFFIQLMSELIARHVVKECKLTIANILYASGGKCYLLLPNIPEVLRKLEIIFNDLNLELFEYFNGDIHVRSGFQALSGGDLCHEKGNPLDILWENLSRDVAKKDYERFSGLDPDVVYEKIFKVSSAKGHQTCEVCHASTGKEGGRERCKTCIGLEELGRQLGNARFIVIGRTDRVIKQRPTLQMPMRYNVWVLEDEPKIIETDAVVLWSINSDDYIFSAFKETIRRRVACAPLMLGSNHRFEKDFEAIATSSKGIKRLGILRMDVDNLGRIFSKGLKNYRHEEISDTGRFHSLARITTLSWQLRLFFEYLLPRIVEDQEVQEEQRVTVVYSGGDDLFLLGAWDALPDLALTVKRKFSEFCCMNPCFSLSGGLILSGGRFPIYKSAEMAGEEEDRAKEHRTYFTGGRKSTKKAAFSFLGTQMHWEEFEILSQQNKSLQAVLTVKSNRPLLHRLREIAMSWAKSKDMIDKKSAKMGMDQIRDALQAERWRWRMVYSLERYVAMDPSLAPVVSKIQKFLVDEIGSSTRVGIELLPLLVRWLEFRFRDSN